jgi:hypothetical protein
VIDVLLEEAGLAGTLGAADEGKRAIDDVGEHAIGDGEIVGGELALGEAGFGVKELFGVGEAKVRGPRARGHRARVFGGGGSFGECGFGRSSASCRLRDVSRGF